MTLEEVLRDKKIKKEDYICLYNKEERRFFGSYRYSDDLNEYMEYEAQYMENKINSKFIHIIKLPSYEHELGLNSIRLEKEKSNRKENPLKTARITKSKK